MNNVAFFEVVFVIIAHCCEYTAGEYNEGGILEQMLPKKSLCKQSFTMQPPSLLHHLPANAQYLKVVCLYNSQYYYTENFTPATLDPDLCTHLNYEFAFLGPGDLPVIISGDPRLDIQQNFYQKATNLKRLNNKLKVFLSLGGWEDSTEKYSELVKNSTKRAHFINTTIVFLRENHFDGLDVAWEYPNAWKGAVGRCPADKDNFVIFLTELKKAFDEVGFGLSASVAASISEINAAYDVPAVSAAVHHLNVMTYDLHGSWESKTSHHAQFNASKKGDSSYMMKSLEEWVKRGADKRKLVVGVPAYGRTCKLHDPDKNGLGEEIAGPGDAGPITKNIGYLAFNEICFKLENENWTVVEDEQVGTYAYSGDQWIGFDSLQALARKVEYVVKQGYGGIALKDVTGDDFNGCCFRKYKFPLLLTIIEKLFETFFSSNF